MKKIINTKLDKIRADMKKLEYVHLYWLNEDWKRLLAQKTILIEILGKYK